MGRAWEPWAESRDWGRGGEGEELSMSVVLETFLVYKLLNYNNKNLKEVVLIALVRFIFSCL